VARISVSLPEGDAYGPQAAAFDEAGRAVVLCYYHGQSDGVVSALVVVDPRQASRGQALPLPGQAFGPIAAAAGRAYVGYHDGDYRQRLAAVDLASGRVLADVALLGLFYGDSLVADPMGHLYTLLNDRLEVRDATTLEVMRSLLLTTRPGPRSLALDQARGRLYLAAGDQLRAYRIPDLTALWETPPLPGEIRNLAVDYSGGRAFLRCEAYQADRIASYLVAVDGETGRPAPAVPLPTGANWQLVAADGEAGYLLLAETQQASTRLWQAGLDGRPAGPEATLPGYVWTFVAGRGHLLGLSASSHLVHLYDPANLQPLGPCSPAPWPGTSRPLGQVPTGVEILNLVVDADRERVYLNDSAGRLHVVDSRTNRLEGSLYAGSGPLVLDAPNGLLFVAREPRGHEVAVVDTAQLAVIAVITGGYKVAVDSAGHRAFVGWAPTGPHDPPGEVQVWDTRTFQRLGTIPHRGEPAYNPQRGEVYLADYSAYIIDGRTFTLAGELTPDIGEQPLQWCNGCQAVGSIVVDPAHDLVIVAIRALSAGKGAGTMPQPRLFSARTLEPVTHTATILTPDWGAYGPFVVSPEGGRVYVAQRYARYVTYAGVVAYPAGAGEPADYRDGLALDYYLPGRQVALALRNLYILAYDPQDWRPLGWIDYYPIHYIDPPGRRLYAWERSLLTVLSFDGGEPVAPDPPEPWAPGKPFNEIRELHFSPAFERDRTIFAVALGQILRSTDGGASWALLHGLPPSPAWSPAHYSLALSPNYARDRTLFLGGYAGESAGLGVWRSTDGGDTWVPTWQGLTHLRVGRVVASPGYAEDGTVLAYCRYQLFWRGEAGSSVFRSTDRGASWAQVATYSDAGGTPPLPQPEELLPYPPADVRFQVGNYGEYVLRSSDGGRIWRSVLRPAQPGLSKIVPSPAFEQDGQVFALAPFVLYRSTDGGLTWQAAADPRATRPSSGPDLTALAVALGQDGQPLVALGDRGGRVALLASNEIEWGPQLVLEPPPPPTTPTPCPPGVAGLWPWPDERLGCPAEPAVEILLAWQPFEQGVMLWRSDRREIYVLYSGLEANRWRLFPDTWQEGQPDRDPALQPAEGREQPIRGFGRVWREEMGGPQAAVGWAMEREQSYTGRVQQYGGGLVLTAPGGQAYALFSDGTWVAE
jgi:photosystem II stability/assembly factor-like uncharacterized protein/DNA-binding beta-propeller fold protein YncE